MAGDMYEEVDGPNENPLAGKCPHGCIYCYVETKLKPRWPNMRAKYSGPIRLDAKVLKKRIKSGTVFLCSCNDLFAKGVPGERIMDTIDWAARQGCAWIIQTKNPRHPLFMHLIKCKPGNFLLGTTMETNRDAAAISKAPAPVERAISGLDFVTIEPIMDFDLGPFADILIAMKPKWVWIGADTAGCGLPEPDAAKTLKLIRSLEAAGIEVRRKKGLRRIMENGV